MSDGNYAAIKAYIASDDGINLEKAFKVERKRLLEQGADEGFDKFKNSKIPELKTEADHGDFIQGCLDAWTMQFYGRSPFAGHLRTEIVQTVRHSS